MLKLYGSKTSPFVRHCRMALIETSIDHEFIEMKGGDANNPSPTRRVPFMQDGHLGLSDSISILKRIRDKGSQPFLETAHDFDLFALSSTLLDAAINVFLFENLDGLTAEKSPYLRRQTKRIESGLDELERQQLPEVLPLNDAHLRLGCLLAWGDYRNRFSLEQRPRLTAFRKLVQASSLFEQTVPPASASLPK